MIHTRFTRRGILAGAAGFGAAAALPAFAHSDQRIVSVGGAVTETIYLLGRQDRLVGADTTSTYPAAANDLPKVGYMRALSAEGVLSLRPDMLIAADGSGPPGALETLAQAGVRIERVPEARSIDDVVEKVGKIADLTDAATKGDVLSAEIARRAEIVAAAIAGRSASPRVLFLMQLREGAMLCAGEGTAAEAIIGLAGGRNALSGFDGYKPVSAESVLAEDPDFILMMAHVAEQSGGVEGLREEPRLSAVPAAREGRIVVMEGLKLLGFGPRTADATAELARHLHEADAIPEFDRPLEAL